MGLTQDLTLRLFQRLWLPLTLKEFALVLTALLNAVLPLTNQTLAVALEALPLKSEASPSKESLLMPSAKRKKLKKWSIIIKR